MATLPLKFNPYSLVDQFVPSNSTVGQVLDKLADKSEAAKPVTLKNGVLTFNKSGNYSIETLPNGKVKIVFDNGPETVLTKAEWLSVTSFNLADANAHLDLDISELGGRVVDGSGYVNLTGVAFIEANQSADGKFEPGPNLDVFVSNLLADHPHDMAFVISHLTINGNTADAFKLVWDYLDDNYSYYNTAINESSIRLGLEYAKYLDAGGAPLTGVMVKFTADGADSGTTPDRLQSLHDNLLGNFDPASITDKFFDSSGGGSNGGSNGTADNALGQQMRDLTSAYASRGVFSGSEGDIGGARHDAVRAFDYDQGWTRPDYVDRATDGVVDARAQADNGLEMRYGDGNTIDGWSIVRHEGAGVELALKVKHRGGSDYDTMQVDADGTVHYHVQEGTSAPNRAEWNFDFAATKLAAGDDEAFTFELLVDRDATAGVDMVKFIQSDNPPSPYSSQNSVNYGFIDTDAATPGTQNYGFGAGRFDVELVAYDTATGLEVARNHIVVHVDNSVVPVI